MSERKHTCQVLERTKSGLYFRVPPPPYNKPTYKVPFNRRTHEHECNTKLAKAS